MSWKGVARAVARVPQRLGRGESTHDVEFDDLAARFTALTKKTESLHKDSIKFRDAISGMLNHQANFSEILVDIYNPVIGGASAEAGTIRRTKTPASTMKMVQEFSSGMIDIRDTILSELELIDRRVIQPANDFLTIIKLVQKTITKRDHKRVDYDRHRNGLKKLKDKKERSLSDEKAMFKLEDQFEQAKKDYEYFNDLLKKELPIFFEYRTQFIEPIFEEFYNLQLKIYKLLSERMHNLASYSNYFDMSSDVLDSFDEKRGNIQEEIESLTLLKKRSKREERERRGSENSVDTTSEQDVTSSSVASKVHKFNEETKEYDDDPPAYTPTPLKTSHSSRGSTYNAQTNPKLYPAATAAANKSPPPLPPLHTKPKSLVKYVVALYDYQAQAEGDLSFKKNDRIQVIERTDDINDWWTGKLRGETGSFPGNYVKEA